MTTPAEYIVTGVVPGQPPTGANAEGTRARRRAGRSRRAVPRPSRTAALALVFVGGATGTAAREGIGLAFPPGQWIPFGTLTVNIVGAFALGLLLAALTGGRSASHRAVKLAVGTGFLGGFTTYSSLATGGVTLLVDGALGAGMLYAIGTLVIGAVASWAGIVAGLALARRAAARRAG